MSQRARDAEPVFDAAGSEALGANGNPDEVPDLVIASGQDLRLWLLKALCGLVASGTTTREGQPRQDRSLPRKLIEVLFGDAVWPSNWDVYFLLGGGVRVWSRQEVSFQLLTNAKTGTVMGSKMHFAGIQMRLLLGLPDNPGALVRRPSRLKLEVGAHSKTIEFGWPDPGTGAITLTRQPGGVV